MRRQLMSNLLGFVNARSQVNRPNSGLSNTLDKFIKPIRDFFQGYTCSHHRSVEYMVESMYYELIPQDRKLDRDFVCQMVGYRCKSYNDFKKGFCFKCSSELDCRAFTMSINTQATSETGYRPDLRSQFKSTTRSMSHIDKFKISPNNNQSNEISHNLGKRFLNNTSRQLARRVLPTSNHYNQNYLPQLKNQYYFDTRHARKFCLHHYHVHVKYRWFRIRESVLVDSFKLMATLANITQQAPIQFNRFTLQSYTLLLTEPVFLGQIESMIIFGDRIKPTLVEYIEVTYMSNLDPRVRALGSARLCRLQQAQSHQSSDSETNNSPTATLFVRCSGLMV